MTDNPNATKTISVGGYDVDIRLQHDDLIYVGAGNPTVVGLIQKSAQEKYGDKISSVAGIWIDPGWHFTVATGHKEQKEKKDDALPVITVDDLAALAQTVNQQYPNQASIRRVELEENKKKTEAEEQKRRAEAERITGAISTIAESNGSQLNDAAKAEIKDLISKELGRNATAGRVR